MSPSAASDPTAVLRGLWRALGGRLAVAAGAGAALAALLAGTPAHVAALRGAAAWILVLALVRAADRWVGWRARRAPVDLAGRTPRD